MSSRALLPLGIKLVRVPQTVSESRYLVFWNGKQIGCVWSQRGFSYRGTQGRNRGIRLQDYHPLEWRFFRNVMSIGTWCYSRKAGIEKLMRESLFENKPEGGD